VRRQPAFLGRAHVIGLVFAVARAGAATLGNTGGGGVAVFALEVAAGVLVGLWLGSIAMSVAGSGAYRATALSTLLSRRDLLPEVPCWRRRGAMARA